MLTVLTQKPPSAQVTAPPDIGCNVRGGVQEEPQASQGNQPNRIDNSVLAVPASRGYRNRERLR
jgi:hypothetical protein